MAPSFRAPSTSVDYPSLDDSSLVPGQIAPTFAASALHGSNSRTNVPDPRRNPPAVEAPPVITSGGRRSFRAPYTGGRPLNNDVGVIDEAASGYAIGNQSGGSLTSAPSENADVEAHEGFDPLWNSVSDLVGIGNKNYGNYSSEMGGFTDAQAHQVHPGTDNADPRHGNAYLASPIPNPDFEPLTDTVIDIQNAPTSVDPVVVPDQKPPSFFHGGRPAKALIPWLYMRPFDKAFADNFTGQKIRPVSPPSVGGAAVTATPRASLPIRTTSEDDVAGDAYPGPTFAAPGMNPIGASRNTWRLQPQPWDTFLIDTGVQ